MRREDTISGESLKRHMKFLSDAIGSAGRVFGGRLAAAGKRVLRRTPAWARTLVERSEWAAPVVVTVLIAVSAAAVGVSGLEALDEQGRLEDALAAEVGQLGQEAKALQDSIASLREDPAALELLAKTHHLLVEPGEVVVLLPPSGEPSPTAPSRELTGYSMR